MSQTLLNVEEQAQALNFWYAGTETCSSGT
jgi:hypothetical protein